MIAAFSTSEVKVCVDARSSGEALRLLGERVVNPAPWQADVCVPGGGTKGRDRYWFRHVEPERTMTLADHAEAWHREQGHAIPNRNSAEWEAMYAAWVAWAFADFRETAHVETS